MDNFHQLFRPYHLILPVTVILLIGASLWYFVLRPAPASAPRAAADGGEGAEVPSVDGKSGRRPREPISRWDFHAAAWIAALFYLIGAQRLDKPLKNVFDECYHARTGMQYVLKEAPTEWTHPPLAKLCIAASYEAFGVRYDPREGIWDVKKEFPARAVTAWRFASLIFGALSLLAMYALARAISGRRIVAIAAAGLLAIDGCFFVQSRIAMTNVFTVCFIVAATLGAWKWRKTGQARWMLLLGFMLGCAIATRWTTLVAWGLLGLYCVFGDIVRLTLGARLRDRLADRPDIARPLYEPLQILATIGLYLLSFLAIPIAIYLLSYIPRLMQHPEGAGGSWFVWLINEQHNMWNYHSGLKEGHPYSSPWWSWPLLLRPVWYYFENTPPPQKPQSIMCLGNALIWWSFIPVMAASAWLAIVRRRDDFALLALMGLGLWLVWAIQPRSLVFTHYLLEAIPFCCIALALFGAEMWDRDDVWGQNLVTFFVSAAIMWHIFYYPMLSALPMNAKFYEFHLLQYKLWV